MFPFPFQKVSLVVRYCLVFITDRRPHSTVHRRRPSLLSCRCSHLGNSLPQHVTSAPSLLVFRARLKTRLFTISYPSP